MKGTYIFALILLLCFSSINAQSKLKKAEESLKEKETNSNDISRVSYGNGDDSSGHSHKDSVGGFFLETIGRAVIGVFLYTGYAVAVESPFEQGNRSSSASLTKYPYFDLNKGNYSYKWNEGSVIGRTTISSNYIFENSRIDGNHLNIDMRFLKRLALELDYLQLWENNPNFGYNELAIYTVLGKYHRVRTEHVDVWWGIGASYVDGSVNDWGFTYGIGAEVFLGKPISVESTFKQSLINNETVNKFNGVLNYHINRYKFAGGYEHLKIGSQKFATMLLGLGITF